MTTVSTHLFSPCAILAATLVSAFLVRARPDWMRFAVLLPCVTAYTAVLLRLVESLLDPRFATGLGPLVQYAEKSLYAAWWFLLARLAITAGRLVLGINRRPKAMHLASDFVAAAVYVAAALAILDLVFGISITGLVATSGIIAIVLAWRCRAPWATCSPAWRSG